MSLLRALVKLLVLLVLVAIIIPVQTVLLPFDRVAWRTARAWHAAVRRVLGITVESIGRPDSRSQVATIANHLSYLDIFVLGSLVRGSFVAKYEVRAWPLFGFLATLQRTVFVSRQRRDAARVVDQLDATLTGGRNLIVFPEGTSSSGRRVLPFKSSAFSAIAAHLDRGLRVQPVTLDVLRVDGHDLRSDADRDVYAYHGGAVLGPHLWAFMRGRGAVVRVTFHPVLEDIADVGRKKLAAIAEACVASGLSAAPTPTDAASAVDALATRHA
jgi:lyso-ornithine lipid O-acyltransferase